jgi:hypothetical protein
MTEAKMNQHSRLFGCNLWIHDQSIRFTLDEDQLSRADIDRVSEKLPQQDPESPRLGRLKKTKRVDFSRKSL